MELNNHEVQFRSEWITRLQATRATLYLLMADCGSSPAEARTRQKLFGVIDIIDARITVEKELLQP